MNYVLSKTLFYFYENINWELYLKVLNYEINHWKKNLKQYSLIKI